MKHLEVHIDISKDIECCGDCYYAELMELDNFGNEFYCIHPRRTFKWPTKVVGDEMYEYCPLSKGE